MIRLATVNDLEQIAPLVNRGCTLGELPAPFAPTVWVASWVGLLGEPNAFIVVREEGGKIVAALGGVVTFEPHTSELIGCQTFMVSDGTVRGAATGLIETFEEESRKRGAKTVALMLTTASDTRVGEAFQRRGYRPLVTEFVKRV